MAILCSFPGFARASRCGDGQLSLGSAGPRKVRRKTQPAATCDGLVVRRENPGSIFA
jgi:hypothetical protein